MSTKLLILTVALCLYACQNNDTELDALEIDSFEYSAHEATQTIDKYSDTVTQKLDAIRSRIRGMSNTSSSSMHSRSLKEPILKTEVYAFNAFADFSKTDFETDWLEEFVREGGVAFSESCPNLLECTGSRSPRNILVVDVPRLISLFDAVRGDEDPPQLDQFAIDYATYVADFASKTKDEGIDSLRLTKLFGGKNDISGISVLNRFLAAEWVLVLDQVYTPGRMIDDSSFQSAMLLTHYNLVGLETQDKFVGMVLVESSDTINYFTLQSSNPVVRKANQDLFLASLKRDVHERTLELLGVEEP